MEHCSGPQERGDKLGLRGTSVHSFSIHKQKIEDVIKKRHALLGAFVILKQLKGRPTFLIERGDLAIKDNMLDGQKLERIKRLRIIQRLVVS
jgi:hypothetical protein